MVNTVMRLSRSLWSAKHLVCSGRNPHTPGWYLDAIAAKITIPDATN